MLGVVDFKRAGRRGGPELYFGVLDGHGGPECAEFAYPLLSVAVSQSLAEEVRAAACLVPAAGPGPGPVCMRARA